LAFFPSFLILFKGSFEVRNVTDPDVNVGGEDGVFVFNLILVFNEGLNSVEFSGLEGGVFLVEGINEFIDVLEEFRDEVVDVSGVNGERVDRDSTLVVINVTSSDFVVVSGVKVVVKVVVTGVLLEHGHHVMLGDQGKHVSLVGGHVVSHFNESTIVTIEVSLESGVGNGSLKEFEESSGVLVGLKLLDEEEISGTSGLESSSEGIDVGGDLIFSLTDFILVSGDFGFDVVDGGTDISTVLVLSGIDVLDGGDVVQKGGFSDCPVVKEILEVSTGGSIKSDQELNDGVDSVTSLDQGLQVEVDLTLGGQSEECNS